MMMDDKVTIYSLTALICSFSGSYPSINTSLLGVKRQAARANPSGAREKLAGCLEGGGESRGVDFALIV